MAASRFEAGEEGFHALRLGPGKRLYVRHAPRFANQRVDLFWQRPGRQGEQTRLALVARLLDRYGGGDPRRRFERLDWLFGADLSVEAQLHGGSQVLHMAGECLAPMYLTSQENLLPELLDAVAETLEGAAGGLDAGALQREITSLRQAQASEWHDKGAYAYRRCLAELQGARAEDLSPEGVPTQLEEISPEGLHEFWRQWAAEAELYIFVSAAEAVPENWADRLWDATSGHVPSEGLVPQVAGTPKWIRESCVAAQSRMVIAFVDGRERMDPASYPVWAVFNALWGAEGNARLFRQLREEQGLCYHVASFIERSPAALIVECALDPETFAQAYALVEEDLGRLRRQGPSDEEVESAKHHLMLQLTALEDAPEGLARFCMQRQSGVLPLPRTELVHALTGVEGDAVMALANRFESRVVYRLYGRDAEASGT